MRGILTVLKVLLVLAVLAVGAAAVIGMALPAGHEATRSARIDVPIAAVYPVLITPENYPDWRPDVTRVERLDSDRFREYWEDGPVVFRILERDPPSRVVITLDDPGQPFSGTWTFELTPEGRQGEWTRLRITERGEVPNPIYRAMARVLMRPADSLEQYLRNLGRRFSQDVTIEP